MSANFPGVGTALNSLERKKNSSSCVYVLNGKWHKEISRRSRAVTTKTDMYQKVCRMCKILVLRVQPIAFLTFSLSRRSSLLKFLKFETTNYDV